VAVQPPLPRSPRARLERRLRSHRLSPCGPHPSALPKPPFLSLLPSTPSHDLLSPLPRAAPYPAPARPSPPAIRPPVVSPSPSFPVPLLLPWLGRAPSLSRARRPWWLALGAWPRRAQPPPPPHMAARPGPARPRSRRPAQPQRVPPPRRGRGPAMARSRRPDAALPPPPLPRVRSGPTPARRGARPGPGSPSLRDTPAQPDLVMVRPYARLRCGGAVRPPAASARLGHGGRSSAVAPGAAPGVLRRPALAVCVRPWPRRGFGAVRSSARLGGLLARLARVACPRQRRARFACVARPRRHGVARGSPRGLLVAACSARGSPSATCSQQHLTRVRSNGPRPRSLARVACSPVQRLNVTLSHLPFVCELSREDVLRHLKVLVSIELYQKAAITRHGLIMLR
jgi:hypothetical protein